MANPRRERPVGRREPPGGQDPNRRSTRSLRQVLSETAPRSRPPSHRSACEERAHGLSTVPVDSGLRSLEPAEGAYCESASRGAPSQNQAPDRTPPIEEIPRAACADRDPAVDHLEIQRLVSAV